MDFYKELAKDIRYEEALKSCLNCGVCTAICPAAEFFEYDPRVMLTTVQTRDNDQIVQLLSEDTIWMCGQCMSCKARCPRGNFPGMLINVLRKVSQESGLFVNSRLGRQQYAVLKTIGKNILELGYCVHPSVVTPELHPEQGDVWEFIQQNQEFYQRFNAVLGQEKSGTLRKISNDDLGELKAIFDETGATQLYETIENYSREKMTELGFGKGEIAEQQYLEFVYSGHDKNQNNE